MAPVFTELHKHGIRLLRYLDDWLLWGLFYQEPLDLTQVLLQLCVRLGICINYDKSCLHPAQELGFLGVNIWTLISCCTRMPSLVVRAAPSFITLRVT